MLVELRVSNYALIEDLKLRPAAGLNVITGETGAGKSMLLGALNLLLGRRNLGGKILLHEDRKCVIEGLFDVSPYRLEAFFESADVDYEPQAILRRELLPTGKSRAFVNDTPVDLDFVRHLSEKIIDIHSQHDAKLLVKANFQRLVIDGWAGHENLCVAYRKSFSAYKIAMEGYQKRQIAWDNRQNHHGYALYQLKELQAANIQVDEQQQLEKRFTWLQSSQSRAEAYHLAKNLLQDGSSSLLVQLVRLIDTLGTLAKNDACMQPLHQRTERVRIELKDIAETLNNEQKDEINGTDEADRVQERLHVIYGLQKKHRLKNCEELLVLQQKMIATAKSLEDEQEALQRSLNHLQVVEAALKKAAESLSTARRQAFKPFSEAITKHLHALGMSQGHFSVAQTTCPFQQDGIDQITFFFSANKGIAPQPLAQVASGGERSRLMFIIKYLLAAKQALPVLVFDEIDTGISGETTKRMIEMMKWVSKQHQLLVISHLPQFAASADVHFLLYKEEQQGRTISKIRALDEKTRVLTLAHMLDGENPSEQAMENARSMRRHT